MDWRNKYYFGYATTVRLKAKVKQAFPNIIWDSMPSDHLSGRELKAGLISKIKTKTRSHSCLISFLVDIIPHVD